MAHAHIAPQELQSVEDQLDLLVDLFTWFGTAKDITVQQYADAVRELDFEAKPEPCGYCGSSSNPNDICKSCWDAMP